MNQVIENILTRRSIRSFIDKEIPQDELDQILKAAIYAPSGMNRQTWQFTVIKNKSKIKQLAKIVGEQLNRTDYNFYNPSILIIPSNIKESIWGKEDNACALENIFLAAHSFGIGSVWINQLQDISDNINVRKFLKEIGIPDNHIIYGAAALGYAAIEPNQDVEKHGIIKIID